MSLDRVICSCYIIYMIKKTKRSAKLYMRINPITKEKIYSYNREALNELVESKKKIIAYQK